MQRKIKTEQKRPSEWLSESEGATKVHSLKHIKITVFETEQNIQIWHLHAPTTSTLASYFWNLISNRVRWFYYFCFFFAVLLIIVSSQQSSEQKTVLSIVSVLFECVFVFKIVLKYFFPLIFGLFVCQSIKREKSKKKETGMKNQNTHRKSEKFFSFRILVCWHTIFFCWIFWILEKKKMK